MASTVLEISCGGCAEPVARYRKEGGGALLRLFLDRIIEPGTLADVHGLGEPLTCPRCGQTLGLPAKGAGGRPAYRLVPGAFRRKKAP
jgi:hypothetical protein